MVPGVSNVISGRRVKDGGANSVVFREPRRETSLRPGSAMITMREIDRYRKPRPSAMSRPSEIAPIVSRSGLVAYLRHLTLDIGALVVCDS